MTGNSAVHRLAEHHRSNEREKGSGVVVRPFFVAADLQVCRCFNPADLEVRRHEKKPNHNSQSLSHRKPVITGLWDPFSGDRAGRRRFHGSPWGSAPGTVVGLVGSVKPAGFHGFVPGGS